MRRRRARPALLLATVTAVTAVAATVAGCNGAAPSVGPYPLSPIRQQEWHVCVNQDLRPGPADDDNPFGTDVPGGTFDLLGFQIWNEQTRQSESVTVYRDTDPPSKEVKVQGASGVVLKHKNAAAKNYQSDARQPNSQPGTFLNVKFVLQPTSSSSKTPKTDRVHVRIHDDNAGVSISNATYVNPCPRRGGGGGSGGGKNRPKKADCSGLRRGALDDCNAFNKRNGY